MRLSFEMRSRNGKRQTNKGEKEKHMKKNSSAVVDLPQAGGQARPPGGSSRGHAHVQHANLLVFTSTAMVYFIYSSPQPK